MNNAKAAQYVLPLSQLRRADVSLAGGKAANLGELMQAQFPVPDGIVLTTDAFARFVDFNRLGAHSTKEVVAAADLPPDIAVALRQALGAFGNTPLAVRSSAVAEDLAGASYAGQYETVLDVRGEEAVARAVTRCWASAFAERVGAYQAARGAKSGGAMAALVQRLVPAEAAGVAFTANPVTGNREETLVSAVRGIGERLVSGQSSPDEWLVRGQEAVCRSAPEGAIDAAQARSVAELARKVERHFESPQDIEWALAGGKLYVLQSRPITTLQDRVEPKPVPAIAPRGFWQRHSVYFPQPISPLCRSTFLVAMNTALRKAFDDMSLLVDTVELREIGGWVYFRIVPLGGKDRRPPPQFLMPLLIRVVPSVRARLKGCVERARSGRTPSYIDRWYREWLPDLTARIAALRDVELSRLSDADLADALLQRHNFLVETICIHMLLNNSFCMAAAELCFAARELLGWEERQAIELVGGLSPRSTEPSRRLGELAAMARERPAVRKLLEKLDARSSDKLAEVDPEFAQAFAACQKEYGCRAIRYEVADPSLAETPQLILGLIRDQMVRGYDPAGHRTALEARRVELLAQARSQLARRTPPERERFERVVAFAEKAYPTREDNEFYTVSAPLALLRQAALEAGRRLVERGQLGLTNDVFSLELEELREALRNPGRVRSLVAERKAERAWIDQHPVPASYGRDPGPPPPLDALPPEARFAMSALLWATTQIMAPDESGRLQTEGLALRGIAAAPGRYTGPVRVILNESEFGKLRPGDVLVCPITSPVWSVIFPTVGALVTDTGGVLSHPAIIAREYRVPAVVACGNATRLLRDGQIVTVDGATGQVEVQ